MNMPRTSVIAFALSLAVSAHAAPAATPLTATQVLNQMNAVSLTNITANSSGHVHGRTWAAGSVTGGEYGNNLGNAPASNYAGVTASSIGNAKVNRGGVVTSGSLNGVTVNEGANVVGGDVANSTLNRTSYIAGSLSGSTLNSGGYVGGSVAHSNINGAATIGGSVANSNVNSNGQAFGGMTADMAAGSAAATSTDFGTVLTGLSKSLSTMKSAGSTVDISGNRATFTAQADASGVAVFDLTAIDEQLFGLGEFMFDLNGASTVIMNTDVSTASIHANFLEGSAQAIGSQVIWNFYKATSLSIDTQFGGSVLATGALVTNTRDIEGGLFANALDLRAQVHVQPFTGNVDLLSPVPEPSMVAMIIAGLALFGGAGHVRRRECFKRD
jgi:choice-of-anchor A domain-containing protein